jgi:lipopolysaccharide/colanic/teichoic acid biosynthesis glycosyltransferase
VDAVLVERPIALRPDEAWRPSASWGSALGRVAKRLLDLGVAGTVLLLLLPLLAAIALLVRRSSPGPVLFRQQRIGKDGRPFELLKFRTMIVNGDEAIHKAYVSALIKGEAGTHDGVFKLADDPRITAIGRGLRKLSLDELPQLINVLRGEMSLVGPRPPLAYEVELYDERARQRLTVPPGVTGLWQVSGRNKLTFQQMIELDLAYIARWSPWLELAIVARTPLALFTGK